LYGKRLSEVSIVEMGIRPFSKGAYADLSEIVDIKT
jgi:hypothetical protein